MRDCWINCLKSSAWLFHTEELSKGHDALNSSPVMLQLNLDFVHKSCTLYTSLLASTVAGLEIIDSRGDRGIWGTEVPVGSRVVPSWWHISQTSSHATTALNKSLLLAEWIKIVFSVIFSLFYPCSLDAHGRWGAARSHKPATEPWCTHTPV